MPGQPLTSETTLAVLLGASKWPSAPDLPDAESFATSAKDISAYFTDARGFKLPVANLLDLFDSERSPLDINRMLVAFLEERQLRLAEAGTPARDLLIYYIGHGGFTPGEQAYFLAIRSTEANNEGISSLRMTDLARTLKTKGQKLRRFLVLDCCFAESAYAIFQSDDGPAGAVRKKTLDDFPQKGTALLCSSSARDVSLAPKGERHTMFSGALIEVLRKGDPGIATGLSLEETGRKVSALIAEKYPNFSARPKVSSPDQRDGDIADIPVFPNAAIIPRPVEDRVDLLERRLTSLVENVSGLDELIKSVRAISSKVDELDRRPPAEDEQSLLKTAHKDLAEQDALLRSAPAEVQIEVRRWRSAKINGIVWFCTSLLIAGLGFYSWWLATRSGGMKAGAFLLRDPFVWLNFLLASFSSWTLFMRSRDGMVAASSQKTPDEEHSWEKLQVVLACRSAEVTRLFGSLIMTSPWFEFAMGTSVIASVFLISACLVSSFSL